MKEPKHTISVLVENKAGVLARIAGLFSARGYNIDSLAVGETEDPSVSRMTIVVKGDETVLEQVEKQLNKLVDIIKVADYVDAQHVERDLALIKVKCDKMTRPDLLQTAHIFGARVLDATPESVIIEMAGPEQKVEALIEMLKTFGIKELVRTGIVAMGRGGKSISVKGEAT